MLFNSLQFLVFFIIVTLSYYLLKHRNRWKLLLLASSYFYMVFIPWYILILLLIIIVDYFAGKGIERASGINRKLFLIISLFANIGILVVFKYYDFLSENLNTLFNLAGIHGSIPYLSFILPIGLSFHTFQAMSYTIEIYRGNQKSEKHFGYYALYVMFYPQLVAGPIERPYNLLPQLRKEHHFDYELFKSGLMKMAWGLFKKAVIADRLSLVVDHAYNHTADQNGATLLIATIFFSFQIYCDFSGYSDMAVGAARIMGIRLMENFNAPYFSSSITEFWRRWHISLSSWFRDYLYFPLGGNRVNKERWWFNILLVFLLSGLWHGAKWTFIIWGLFHGCCILIESLLKRKIPGIKIHAWIRTVLTFSLVSFSWIFFRSDTLGDAFYTIRNIFNFSRYHLPQVPMNGVEIAFCFTLIALLLSKEKWNIQFNIKKEILYYSCLAILILSCYLFGIFTFRQFIYFQF